MGGVVVVGTLVVDAGRRWCLEFKFKGYEKTMVLVVAFPFPVIELILDGTNTPAASDC